MFCLVFINVLFSMNVLVKGGNSCTTYCKHKVNETAPLHFLNTVKTVLFSPPGAWADLNCCADGFTDIQWYYHSSTNTTWQPWPWFEPCEHCIGPPYREVCDKGQKLQFLSISLRDTGSYRCNVSNSITGKYILREYKVVVKYCDNIEGDIHVIKKPDSPQQQAGLATNQTFICAGYFGCPADTVRHANWSYVDAEGNTNDLLPGQDKHFHIVYNQSFPEITVGSTLTIVGVEEQDFHLTFQCNLATSELYKAWNMTLHPPEYLEKLNIQQIIIIVGSVVGAFVLLVLVPGTVCYCLKPQIHYRINSKLGKLRPRNADEDHDACIIHSEANEDFVDEYIKTPLEEENYDIFTNQTEMVPEGQSEVEEARNIDKSTCAILILSREEIEDKRVIFMFSVAVDSCGDNILVIEKGDVEKNSWQKAVEGEKTMKNLPQMCKTIKWRGTDKMSKRQIKNFLYSVRLHLPEPRVTRRVDHGRSEHRIQSDSSSAPLMPERNTSVASNSSVAYENPDSRKIQKRNSSQNVNDSTVLVRLSASDHQTPGSANNNDLRDEVFISVPQKRGPPKSQLSHDSGFVNSP